MKVFPTANVLTFSEDVSGAICSTSVWKFGWDMEGGETVCTPHPLLYDSMQSFVPYLEVCMYLTCMYSVCM